MIHFVEQTDDIKQIIKDALFPLRPSSIKDILIKSQSKSAIVIVEDKEVGRAVGKFGVNVCMVQELIKWKIDIKKESEHLHITSKST